MRVFNVFFLNFLSVDSNDNSLRKSALKPNPKIFDDDIISCTESDLEPGSDESTKKDKKSSRATTSSKKPDPDVKRVS